MLQGGNILIKRGKISKKLYNDYLCRSNNGDNMNYYMHYFLK